MKKKLLKALIAGALVFGLNFGQAFAADDRITSDDPSDFVLLADAVPDVIQEIRYYSTYNFVGDRVDGYAQPVALMTKQAAAALRQVSDYVMQYGYRLKIYDAYRPQKAVDNFVRWSENVQDTRMKDYFYPLEDKRFLFDKGYIALYSGHSRGSTVDLTLFDMRTGKEVDMGGTFDYFGLKSHPDYRGELTQQQIDNRMFLRDAMIKFGFKPLDEEWWHFTLKDEPYPDTYFTFDSNVFADPNHAQQQLLEQILMSVLWVKNAAEYREHKTAIDSVQKALVDAARPLSDYCDTLTANPDADYFLGVLYSYGIVKQKYTNVARRYFDRAEQTYSDALVMLAVNREPYWRDLLQEAVEAGNAEAAYLCGIELYNKTEAMKLFRSAAEQGYVDAMYEIARKDNDFNFCHAAAEAGHAFAQETLSRLYKNRVNEADSTFTWAKRAAEQGVREIYKTVGDYFAKGYGTPQDDKQAFYWYKRAADNGDRDAQIEVAFACYYGRGTEVDRLKAFVLGDGRVRALYENGPTKDMLLIANAYEFGSGLPKSIDAANYWYKKAADCFAKGRNVKQDYQQAFYCYKCAANNGDRDAQIEVAFAYYYGRGTEVDRLKAFVLSDANVRALYENGPTEDMLLIADAYEYRKGGLPKSINDAIYWYRKAADRFNIEASYRLGLCCKNFIYSNNEYAFMCYKYLSAASAEGHTAAKNELEKIFSEATGKPQYRIANALETYRFNEQEIFRLYKNAAEKGHAQAQYELGIRYRYGIGTKKSWFKARSWLKKAADKNIRQAQKNYDEMGDEAYNKIFNQKIFIIALLIALFVGVSMYEDNNPPPKSPHKPNPSVSVSHTQTPKPTTRTEEKPKPSRKVHNRSDLSVGGISVDDSLQHVHEILGKEKSVTDPYKTKHFHYQFDGVEVDIYNGKVYSIIVRTNKLETRRGIRVGDSYDDVRLEYGNKNAMEFEKDGILYCEYWFLSPDSKKKSLLRFAIKNGVVNYIGARIYND